MDGGWDMDGRMDGWMGMDGWIDDVRMDGWNGNGRMGWEGMDGSGWMERQVVKLDRNKPTC